MFQLSYKTIFIQYTNILTKCLYTRPRIVLSIGYIRRHSLLYE